MKKYFYIIILMSFCSLLNSFNVQEYQRIKSEKLSTSHKEILNLDFEQAQDLAQTFIKQEKIYIQLLEAYGNWLFADSKKILVPDGKQLIMIDNPGWFKQTVYDDARQAVWRYFDMTKQHEMDVHKRLLGILLLYTIFNQSNHTIELDAIETTIYDTCLPKAIKTMLKKTHSISFYDIH